MNGISVIIPSYNRATPLLRAIHSVYNQTLPPDEVIIIDDGSTDNTRQIVTETFPHANYRYQPNRGVSAARNLGIKLAQGEWLAFLDSDDEWLPGKLAQQYNTMNTQSGVKIIHTNETWIRYGQRVNQMKKHTKYGGMIFRQCLPRCIISPSSVMVHRGIFDEIGNFDENLPACEDYDLWLRCCARHPVYYIDEPLIIKYGGHADQLSRKHWGMDRFRIRALNKIMQSGELNDTDLQAVAEMLMKKIDIYLIGAEKRKKWDEIKYYKALAGRFMDSPLYPGNTYAGKSV